jgi:hypothetical protein
MKASLDEDTTPIRNSSYFNSVNATLPCPWKIIGRLP